MKINGLSSESVDYANPISITNNANLDFNKHYTVLVTSADKTLTLPAVSGNSGKIISIQIDSSTTKLITIDGNSNETIDGETTRIMWAGESCTLLCNGNSWNKIGGRTIPFIGAMNKSAAQTLTVNSRTKITLDNILGFTNFNTMTSTTNGNIVIQRAGRYEIRYCFKLGVVSGTTTLLEALVYINTSYSENIDKFVSGSGQYEMVADVIYKSLNISDVVELYGAHYGTTNKDSNPQSNLHVIEIPQW